MDWSGGRGTDALDGGAGNDVLEGGVGDDALLGGAGTDTASYAGATGGQFVDLTAGTASGADGADVLFGIENVTGSAFNDQLRGDGAANVLDGGAGDDLLNGRGGDDQLAGGAGNDTADYRNATGGVTVDLQAGTASGADGTDTLSGIENVTGSGFDDVLTGDAGANMLWAGAGNDRLEGEEGADTLVGGSGDDVLIGGLGADFVQGDEGADLVIGSAGDDQLLGGADNDTLQGEEGDDLLKGGLGDDSLVGGEGHDTYEFNLGDGIDTLTDSTASGLENHLAFGAGITRADLTLIHDETAHTLMINVGTDGDAVRILNFDPTGVNGTLSVATVGFADGTTANLADLLAPTPTSGDDVLNYGAGNDVVNALAGNDMVDGGAGNDTLIGGTGNDTLTGGTGDDILDSGEGKDTILFGRGDGQDTLGGLANNDDDTVQFGAGISFRDLWFAREGNDLVMSILSGTGADDSLTVTDWYGSKKNQVDEFRTADGWKLEDKDVEQLRQAMAAFAPLPSGGDGSLPPAMPSGLDPILAEAWENK